MSASSQPDAQALGRVVVLGGLGFMGSHICRELVARRYPLRIFDRLYALRTLVEDIEDRIEIVEGDMALTDDVMNALSDAETVIHLVHTTVPGSSMKDPAYDLSSNVVASVGWLSRLDETKVRRIIYVSSGGTVYGLPQTNPISENHPTDPISSYGITKLTIEKYVAMYAAMFGIDYCIVRPSNVYGPGQKLHIGQGVIGVLSDRALRGEPLEVWGTGESLRDYLHVEDLVQAIAGLVAYMGPQKVFNISSGAGRSVLDIIRILNRCLGFAPALIYKPDRGFDVPVNVLDSSRLHAETGWRPMIGLEDGVERTVEWLRRLQKHGAGAA